MNLARGLARRFANRGEQLEDLEQVAFMGLLKAADRFDTRRDVKFSTFATVTITGELKRHFRDKRWRVHVSRTAQERYLAVRDTTNQLATALGRSPTVGEVATALTIEPEDVMAAREVGSAFHVTSLDAPRPDGEGYQPAATDGGYAEVEAASSINRAIAALGDRERDVVALRFHHRLSQAEIGQRLGMSQMHVSRLLSRALGQVRAQLDAAV